LPQNSTAYIADPKKYMLFLLVSKIDMRKFEQCVLCCDLGAVDGVLVVDMAATNQDCVIT
jgi:hypothetical protein